MDKPQFRALAALLFNNKFSDFYTWVEKLPPDGHPALNPLTDEMATPTFGGIYLVLRLTGLLPDIENKLAAKARQANIDPEVPLSCLNTVGDWAAEEVLCGGFGGLARELSRCFKRKRQPCFKALVDIADGDILTWLNHPAANTASFRGMVEAFRRFGQLDRLQALVLGLPRSTGSECST